MIRKGRVPDAEERAKARRGARTNKDEEVRTKKSSWQNLPKKAQRQKVQIDNKNMEGGKKSGSSITRSEGLRATFF